MDGRVNIYNNVAINFITFYYIRIILFSYYFIQLLKFFYTCNSYIIIFKIPKISHYLTLPL